MLPPLSFLRCRDSCSVSSLQDHQQILGCGVRHGGAFVESGVKHCNSNGNSRQGLGPGQPRQCRARTEAFHVLWAQLRVMTARAVEGSITPAFSA